MHVNKYSKCMNYEAFIHSSTIFQSQLLARCTLCLPSLSFTFHIIIITMTDISIATHFSSLNFVCYFFYSVSFSRTRVPPLIVLFLCGTLSWTSNFSLNLQWYWIKNTIQSLSLLMICGLPSSSRFQIHFFLHQKFKCICDISIAILRKSNMRIPAFPHPLE